MRAIVEQARAVIFAGGTLSPTDDLAMQLLGDAASRVSTHSWDHVVPADHVLALSVATGPSGQSFDFTFSQRAQPALITELGNALVALAAVVPDGMVLFFPSYAYEDEVMRAWAASGVLARLERVKTLLREPRGAAGGTEETLRAFRTHVETPRTAGRPAGAVLSCVVGGKLSEGINFSDALGRCVVMIGLPYANRSDPVLRERMAYLDAKYTRPNRPRPGEDFYESLCTRAVNQSIGRAIRHADYYAAIVLLDARFTRPQSVARLPRWIGKSHSVAGSFDQTINSVRSFFADPWKMQQQARLEAARTSAASVGRASGGKSKE
jgi:chromosome transmission fidelity protein 1